MGNYQKPRNNAPQPSGSDYAWASAPVRLLHSVFAEPVENLGSVAAQLLSQPAPEDDIDAKSYETMGDPQQYGDYARQGYDSIIDKWDPVPRAVAAVQNTPGYAAARAAADKAIGRSGFQDQIGSAFLPGIAGTVGLLGGLDESNAMADAQQAAQDAYQQKYPYLSLGAGVVGDFFPGTKRSPMPGVRSSPEIPWKDIAETGDDYVAQTLKNPSQAQSSDPAYPPGTVMPPSAMPLAGGLFGQRSLGRMFSDLQPDWNSVARSLPPGKYDPNQSFLYLRRY